MDYMTAGRAPTLGELPMVLSVARAVLREHGPRDPLRILPPCDDPLITDREILQCRLDDIGARRSQRARPGTGGSFAPLRSGIRTAGPTSTGPMFSGRPYPWEVERAAEMSDEMCDWIDSRVNGTFLYWRSRGHEIITRLDREESGSVDWSKDWSFS